MPSFPPTSAEHSRHAELNKDILQCRNSRQLEDMVLGARVGDFNAVNCSTAISKLANFTTRNNKNQSFGSSPAVTKLYSLASKQYFMPRAVVSFCHAIASAQLDSRVPDFMLHQIRLGNNEDDEFPLADYTSQGLGLLMWSFAKLDQPDEFVFSRACREIAIKRNLKDFDSQHLFMIVWSLAKVRYNSDAVFRKVSLELQRREWADCRPQHLAAIALAYAKMRQHRHTPLLFHSMSRTCLMQKSNAEFAKDFGFQAVSSLCFSFASQQHKDDGLFKRFARALMRKQEGEWMREATNEGIAKILWAFAKMAVKSDEVGPDDELQGLYARCSQVLLQRGDFANNAIALTMVLWSMAKLGVRDEALFDRAAQAIKRHHAFLAEFKPQELSNALWAFAKQEHKDPALVEHFANELLHARQVERFVEADLVELAWALVRLGQRKHAVVHKLVQEIQRRPLADYSTGDLADVVWVLVAVDQAAGGGSGGGGQVTKLADFTGEIARRRSTTASLNKPQREQHPHHT